MSILVATGTTGFDALAEEMDRLSVSLGEPVTIQIGGGSYLPRHARYFRLAPALEPHYRAADLVVAHGGLATCTEVLELGRPLVAVAANDRYDDHQRDLLAALEALGHLLYCRRLRDLGDAIPRARRMRFEPYVRPECTVHLRIKEYLAVLDWR